MESSIFIWYWLTQLVLHIRAQSGLAIVVIASDLNMMKVNISYNMLQLNRLE